MMKTLISVLTIIFLVLNYFLFHLVTANILIENINMASIIIFFIDINYLAIYLLPRWIKTYKTYINFSLTNILDLMLRILLIAWIVKNYIPYPLQSNYIFYYLFLGAFILMIILSSFAKIRRVKN